MIFYNLRIKISRDTGSKVYPMAKYIDKNKEIGKLMNEYLYNNYIPTFYPEINYFQLSTLSNKKEYAWIKLDVYKIISQYGLTFIASPKFKNIFDSKKYKLGDRSSFHPCRIKYNSEWMNYYFFQLLYDPHVLNKSKTEYRKGIFSLKSNRLDLEVESIQDIMRLFRLPRLLGVGKEYSHHYIEAKLPAYRDFFFNPVNKGFVVSERLRIDLESKGITGIEFIDLPYTKFVFDEL